MSCGLVSLAERCEAYDPRQSPDNRADEFELHAAIVMETGLGSLGDHFERTFVRSIDAALTLVPEGRSVRVGWCTGAGYAEVFAPGSYGDRPLGTGTVSAATPALALCAAALRARGEQVSA